MWARTVAEKTPRHTASPLRLLADALGSPITMAAKLWRLAEVLAGYARPRELDSRLLRLRSLGLIDAVPSKIQLLVGARDMVKFWVVPASEQYYSHEDINFTFHQ